ncbi:MAG: hypothetical protein GDA39_05565, partial [Hyphomonadaceae bacterium]|nr:hypothetical protein [Hyphomonadaceae bacterium]
DLKRTGYLHPEGVEEALCALKRFREIARTQKLDRLLIGATAALRMAEDASIYIARVKRETGLDITPLSGKDEARLTAQGLIATEPRAHGIAADLGGASLELVHVDHGQVGQGISYPVGPFSVVDQDLGADWEQDSQLIRDRISVEIDKDPVTFITGQPLYLIGGAWRNLASVHQQRHLYPLKTLQAYELMPGAAQDLARWAYGPGRLDVLYWPDIPQRRAETLPYCGLMLDVLLKRLKPARIVISSSGLRQGLVYDAMPEELKSRDPLLDGCRDLARGNLQGLGFDQPLIRFLSDSDHIYPAAFDADNESRIRRAACHLVGIGKGLHPDYRAELVFDEVLYAPLQGLTHKERAYLALMLYHSYTSKQHYTNVDAMQLLLSMREREAALIYGTAIRLAVVASGRSKSLVEKFQLYEDKGCLCLDVDEKYTDLYSERVVHRLKGLAGLLGLTTNSA